MDAVVGLRKLGYHVGSITDSYHIAAKIVRRRVFADFALANVVEFRHGKATEDVTLPPSFRSEPPAGAPKTNSTRSASS